MAPSAFLALQACSQDNGSAEHEFHGKGSEITVTVHDSSGEPISAAAMVKLYRDGSIPSGQGETSRGHAIFVVNSLGEYTVIVKAAGFADAQKEVSIIVAGREQVDVYLRPSSAAGNIEGVPGRPLLAPKAKEALDKGLQALSADKMREAEKFVDEAMRLAPGHPDVLYVQGVLYLRQRNWAQAQDALNKATQVDPNHARAFAALGMALCDQEKYDAAIEPLEKSLQLDADAVTRFAYRNDDLKASGLAQHVVDLPHGRGHWTRDVVFSRDGKTLFVAVGSGSNVDDPDTTPAERDRADILAFDPDGSHMRVYASGIRNPSGVAIDPRTGRLWCTVNERDGLGDNLVPDYITAVREGGFYGWPWWYMGPHQDPRHLGKHPELRERVIVPDVLLQPHNASLQIAFYQGQQFPDEYHGDIFATEHGSWNKSVRAGYEVIRLPLHPGGKSGGEYQDFLTGFVLPTGRYGAVR